MLYQLSYTPKHRAERRAPFPATRPAATMALSQRAGSLAASPKRRKAIQAAARFRFSPSSAFTVDPATGLEKI